MAAVASVFYIFQNSIPGLRREEGGGGGKERREREEELNDETNNLFVCRVAQGRRHQEDYQQQLHGGRMTDSYQFTIHGKWHSEGEGQTDREGEREREMIGRNNYGRWIFARAPLSPSLSSPETAAQLSHLFNPPHGTQTTSLSQFRKAGRFRASRPPPRKRRGTR
jgi:hypothetical protein